MAIVKKNLVSIICGVVALLAIIASFWPVGPMFGELNAELAKRKQVYDDVDKLHKQQRKLPVLVLTGTAAGSEGSEKELGRFPNDKVIEVGQLAAGGLKGQSDAMLKTVSDLNVHEQLIPAGGGEPGALPAGGQRLALDFVDAYLAELGITDPPEPGKVEEAWTVGLPAAMNATRPPTQDDINLIADQIWKEYDIKIMKLGGEDTSPQVNAEFQSATMDLMDRERMKRAKNHTIYLMDGALEASPKMQVGQPPRIEDVWFAQTVLWIQQDVCKSIIETNTSPDPKKKLSVLEAPIKHLVSFRTQSFGPDMFVTNQVSPGAVAAPAEGAAAIPRDPVTGAPQVYVASPSGRVCDDLYDVVNFELVLRVDYSKIPQIIADLERNRLFTVLSTSISSVNAAEERKTNGFVYGEQPVAEVTLICEALFLRSWTVDKDHQFAAALMPEIVRQTLGIEPGPGLTGQSFAPGGGIGVPGRPMPDGGMEP